MLGLLVVDRPKLGRLATSLRRRDTGRKAPSAGWCLGLMERGEADHGWMLDEIAEQAE
jgi:hypothetical protein